MAHSKKIEHPAVNYTRSSRAGLEVTYVTGQRRLGHLPTLDQHDRQDR